MITKADVGLPPYFYLAGYASYSVPGHFGQTYTKEIALFKTAQLDVAFPAFLFAKQHNSHPERIASGNMADEKFIELVTNEAFPKI